MNPSQISLQNYRLFPAHQRGHADYGWLKTYYSFSFADWYNPQQMHFGALRVLNDDTIAPHSGFDFHPHNNMEIITILLQGELTHQDSMGNKEVIKENEVQVMSAGTGILHAEKNESTKPTKLFQIWIFPDKKNHVPRYQQKSFLFIPNQFQLLVSPKGSENSLWIHQNAFISRGIFENQQIIDYQLKDSNNGIYLMLIEGEIKIDDITLKDKDAIGIWKNSQVSFRTNKPTDMIIIEVPLN